ncbi:DMT family transporter [Antarcticimicrobium luteum]|uniref:DMT family transporter n=1 Tax=Antarcticimicrobium luteum TaxID=2547397 RepID=A0A4R5V6Z8_9RHOB|nr:DMT family transporter [Antarcticimicrobium luteum]TDK47375.1 DMT family transporter [Antarcticimicrobium luteum]
MSTQKSISPRAWAELSLLGLIWGASFLTMRIALNEIPVLTVVLHRVFWAMLVLWAVVFAMRLPVPRAPRVWAAFLMMGLLNNVIPFGLMTWGQLHIESGLTAILNATTAIFGVIVAALVFADERLTWRRGVGVAIGFAGVTLAIGAGQLTAFDPRSMAQLAVLGGTLSYALASSWARSKLGGLAPQVAAAGMLTGSTLVLLPAAWVIDGPVELTLAPATWGAIGYYALAGTAGAYLLYYRVLGMAGSGNLMLVTLIIPPVAIVLGALVLGEALSPSAFGGFALLALGLLIVNGKIGRRRD